MLSHLFLFYMYIVAIADYNGAAWNNDVASKAESVSSLNSACFSGLRRNSKDDFDLSVYDFEQLLRVGSTFGMKVEDSFEDISLTPEAMLNKQDIVSRLKARAKVMAGELKKLPIIQSRVIRLYLSSNYKGKLSLK